MILFQLLFFSTLLNASNNKLLFYVGITMIKPINILVKEFEKEHNCTIKILQGGSQDLYESAKMSGIGDLYFPGSTSYRDKNFKDGLLLDAQFVGYNQLALIVKKRNPKDIKPTIFEVLNPKYRVVLGNAESGSIGNATKKVLSKLNIYEPAIMNTIYLESDSRNLSAAIKEDKADLIVNWYATSFWKENRDFVTALKIEPEYSNKAVLALNLLKSSKNKELTRKFMKFASSKRGKEIFFEYGFLTEDELKNFDKVKIK